MTATDEEWEGFWTQARQRLQDLGYDSTQRDKLKFLLLGLPWPACRRYVQGDDIIDDDEVRATLDALLRQLQVSAGAGAGTAAQGGQGPSSSAGSHLSAGMGDRLMNLKSCLASKGVNYADEDLGPLLEGTWDLFDRLTTATMQDLQISGVKPSFAKTLVDKFGMGDRVMNLKSCLARKGVRYVDEDLGPLLEDKWDLFNRLTKATIQNLQISGVEPSFAKTLVDKFGTGPSGAVEGAAMAGAKGRSDPTPQQEATQTRCCMKVLVMGKDGRQMHATALVDTGFLHDLLLSERMAMQLGLEHDGSVSPAIGAGGSTLMLLRYGNARVALCVEDDAGQEHFVNERHLGCWALDGRSAPNSTFQNVMHSSSVVDASYFTDRVWKLMPDSLIASSIQRKPGVHSILRVRSEKDCHDYDILLGRPAMSKLQFGIDKKTGDMVCLLHGPDRVGGPR